MVGPEVYGPSPFPSHETGTVSRPVAWAGGLRWDAWTGRHNAWLRHEALQLTSHATRLQFDPYYETVPATKPRRARPDTAIERRAADSVFTPLVPRLGCLRGPAR